MCIFTGEIGYVSSTRIFSRIDANRQAIIYDMYLSTDNETAMVLPIPVTVNGSENAVEFVDLSDYDKIFDDIEDLFPVSRGPSLAAASAMVDGLLAVTEVGIYEASYVPSPEEFDRLDPRFRLNDGFFQKMPNYKDYGFVVFKLKPGESQVHPMAFWFPARDTNKLYFPTVHMHDGEIHDYEEFSHRLYAQGNIAEHHGLSKTIKAAKSDKIKAVSQQSQGIVAGDSEISKQSLFGKLENKDVWFDIS